jgi:hypothetical protein
MIIVYLSPTTCAGCGSLRTAANPGTFLLSELDNDLPSVHENPNKNDKDNVEQRPQRARAVVHVALCPRPSGEVPLAALGLLLLKSAKDEGWWWWWLAGWLAGWLVGWLVGGGGQG